MPFGVLKPVSVLEKNFFNQSLCEVAGTCSGGRRIGWASQRRIPADYQRLARSLDVPVQECAQFERGQFLEVLAVKDCARFARCGVDGLAHPSQIPGAPRRRDARMLAKCCSQSGSMPCPISASRSAKNRHTSFSVRNGSVPAQRSRRSAAAARSHALRERPSRRAAAAYRLRSGSETIRWSRGMGLPPDTGLRHARSHHSIHTTHRF